MLLKRQLVCPVVCRGGRGGHTSVGRVSLAVGKISQGVGRSRCPRFTSACAFQLRTLRRVNFCASRERGGGIQRQPWPLGASSTELHNSPSAVLRRCMRRIGSGGKVRVTLSSWRSPLPRFLPGFLPGTRTGRDQGVCNADRRFAAHFVALESSLSVKRNCNKVSVLDCLLAFQSWCCPLKL